MPYKRPPSKTDLRKKLQQEVSLYLQDGGEVDQIPKGKSGRNDSTPFKTVLFDSPKEPRTYVNDVVANIDLRKKPPKPEHTRKKSTSKGHYKTLYDDFGEPIRRIWVDD